MPLSTFVPLTEAIQSTTWIPPLYCFPSLMLNSHPTESNLNVSNLNWVTWLPLKGIKLERAIWNPVRTQIGKKLQYLDWKRSSTSENLKPSVPPDTTSPYVKQTKSIQHDLQSPSSPLPPHLCFCRGKIITKSSTRNNNKGPCLCCKTKFLF